MCIGALRIIHTFYGTHIDRGILSTVVLRIHHVGIILQGGEQIGFQLQMALSLGIRAAFQHVLPGNAKLIGHVEIDVLVGRESTIVGNAVLHFAERNALVD